MFDDINSEFERDFFRGMCLIICCVFLVGFIILVELGSLPGILLTGSGTLAFFILEMLLRRVNPNKNNLTEVPWET